MQAGGFVEDLAIVLSVAGLTGLAARKLKQPPVLGYLLAGLLVGPYIPLPLFADPHRVQELSDFGVVLVMFAIGLEFRVQRFLEVLPRSGLAAAAQMGVLAWCGVSLAAWLGWSPVEGLFLGGCLAISSTMLVSKVFQEQPVSPEVSSFVMGILVLQDIVAIGLVAALSGLAAGGQPSLYELALVEGRVGLFLLALTGIGMLFVPALIRYAAACESEEVLLVAAGGCCFGFAFLAAHFGYSVALGSFVAGVLVAESGERESVEHLIKPLRDLFGAVFFVSVGMTVDPSLAVANLGSIGVVSLCVIFAHLASVTTGALLSGLAFPQGVTAALALGQLGEFAFLLAAIGSEAGLLRPSFRPIVVTAAVITAFTTPALLARASPLAAFLSRRLPLWLRTSMAVYQGWIERLRAAPKAPRSLAWKTATAVILDGILLVGGAVGILFWLQKPQASKAPLALAGLGAIPLLFGLMRNTQALSNQFVEMILKRPHSEAETQATQNVAAPVIHLLTRLGVLVGIGFPAAAILRPFLRGPYLASALALMAAFLLDSVRRRSAELDKEVVSGTALLLRKIASNSHADRVHRHHETSESAALGTILTVPLKGGSPAIGKTLKDLEVRARTGALVLAIHRTTGDVVHPTPEDLFQDGDVVALLGNKAAMIQAARMLSGDTEVEPPV